MRLLLQATSQGGLHVDSFVRRLNPLLKLAAISGVETAIKLHIRRGDDLDARDGSGSTPLILAAGKGRKGAVRLLLDAGADPTLVDESGMDALAHAVKGGCSDTIAVLVDALARVTALEPASGFSPQGVEMPDDDTEVASPDRPAKQLPSPVAPPVAEMQSDEYGGEPEAELVVEARGELVRSVEIACNEVVSEYVAEVVLLDGEPLDELFQDDWEAEEEVLAPEGDETVAVAARQVHENIGRHKVVDRDEDWGDVDLHLPVRAAPLARDEGTGAVRSLLLAALREGMLPEGDLIEICLNADGSRNEEAERLLAMVAGELGANIVEWTGAEEPFRAEPTLEEECLLTDAVEFAEDLASGRNDPFRYYSKDIRGDLLTAEEEIALGREMEEASHAALSALALWPEGLSALVDAAARVARREADVGGFCAGPEPSSDDEPTSRTNSAIDESDEDDEPELDEDALFFVNAVAAVEIAQGDVRRTTEALEKARLTRGFLLELAGMAEGGCAGRGFVDALNRQGAARERMILCNLRLAFSIAKKHLWSGIPLDDLVQEANIGLMKAVERFDWRRGFRFSTYATWWIRQQVSRSIADTGRVVRAPVHIQETARKVLRERQEAEIHLGRAETIVETARRVGMSSAKVRMLISMFDDVASLNEIDPDTELPRAEGLVDANATDPAEVAERASLRAILLGMLDDLDERSREVILLRFGLTGKDVMTLEEVGQHFGVTRERVRQIEVKAMRRLSHRNKQEILWPFMGEGYAPASTPLRKVAQEPPPVPSPEAETASPDEEEQTTYKAPGEFEAASLPPPRLPWVIGVTEKPVLVRVAAEDISAPRSAPTTPAPVLAGDQALRILDEGRALGPKVGDHRSEGVS